MTPETLECDLNNKNGKEINDNIDLGLNVSDKL